jgi:membrane-associated phospholipid phosphatase
LALARRPLATGIATVLGLLLCFGRVYTGMHYPFDVVGGLAVGGIIMLVTFPLAVPVLERIDRALVSTRWRRLVAAGGAGLHATSRS